MSWLVMLTSQAKNKITVVLETDQIAQMASCYLTGACQSCETTRFQTSGYVTIPSESFSLVGYTLSEREDTGSSRGSVTLSFPSRKFPFSCLTAQLAVFFSVLASQEPSYTVDRNVNWYRHCRGQYGGGGGLVTESYLTLVTTWTVAHQVSLSMGFPRQGYLSELPFPSLGDLLNPRIEPRSHSLHTDSLVIESPVNPWRTVWRFLKNRTFFSFVINFSATKFLFSLRDSDNMNNRSVGVL